MAVLGFSLDNQLDNNGVTTTATVTEVGDVNIAVEFRTEDHQRATAEFTWWPEEYPEVDDRIEITYDRDDPSYAIAAGSDEDQIMATVLAVAAVLAFVAGAGASIGAVLVHRARGKAARSPGYYYLRSSSSSSLARNSFGRCGVNAGLGRVPGTSSVTRVDLIGRQTSSGIQRRGSVLPQMRKRSVISPSGSALYPRIDRSGMIFEVPDGK